MSREERFVRDFLSVHEFTVLFSGGKDSLAALLWVIDNVPHERWDVLYVEVTGNTHPLCTRYVYEVIDELGLRHRFKHVKREDLDFFDCLKRWGVPLLHGTRWCLKRFKLDVITRHARPIQVSGVKMSDSSRRRKIKHVNVFRMTSSITVHPILTWSDKQVLEYIESRGLKLNPCYELYGHSGNCMFCPYYSIDMIRKIMSDPIWGKKIAEALREIATEGRGETTRRVARKWLRYHTIGLGRWLKVKKSG